VRPDDEALLSPAGAVVDGDDITGLREYGQLVERGERISEENERFESIHGSRRTCWAIKCRCGCGDVEVVGLWV
jgi:hypothetical protein